MTDAATGRTGDARGEVYSRSFLALVATQFFVSLNDNMFRWLVMGIGKELLHNRWSQMPTPLAGPPRRARPRPGRVTVLRGSGYTAECPTLLSPCSDATSSSSPSSSR